MRDIILNLAASCMLTAVALASSGAPAVPEALRAGTEGRVTVEVITDAEGNVKDARVLESTPPGTFDAHALAAAKSRRFPATGKETKFKVVFDYEATPG